MLMMRTAVRFFGLVLLWHATTAQEGGGCSGSAQVGQSSFELTCAAQTLRGELGTSELVPADWCADISDLLAVVIVDAKGETVDVGAVSIVLEGEAVRLNYQDLGAQDGFYRVSYGTAAAPSYRYGKFDARVFTRLVLEVEGGEVGVDSGQGEITSEVCARTSCAYEFERGGDITLTARPSAGRTFKEWSSDINAGGDTRCTGSNSTTIVLSAQRSTHCKAVFDSSGSFVVDVQAPAGVSQVTVSGAPPMEGTNTCTGELCSWTFEKGASGQVQITLEAEVQAGYRFDGWAANCRDTQVLSTDLRYTITLSQDESLCAKTSPLTPTEHTLTVEVQGVGSVQISSSGQPIATCTSGACAEVLPHNASIRLTPSANVTWSGANATICELRDGFRLTEDIHCIAVFEAGADCSSPVEAPELEAWQAGSLIAPSGGLYEVTSGMPVEVRVVNAVPAQQPIYHWRSERDSNWRAITNQAVVVSDSFTCSGLPEVIEVRLTACNKTEITSITFNCQ